FAVSIPQDSRSGSVSWGQLYPGQVVFCDVYEILKAPSTAYGTVYISMHGCPAALTPTSDPNTLAQKCQAPMTGVTVFAVSRYSYYSDNRQGQINAASNYQFTDVRAGDLTVSSAIPGTYGTPVIFCKAQIAGQTYGTVAYKQFPATTTGGYANIAWGPLLQDQAVLCDWYQIPRSTAGGATDAASTVTVNVWQCASVVPNGSTVETFKAACTQAVTGVTFSLTTGGTSRTSTTVGGKVEWTGLPNGAFSISRKTSPGGSGQAAFCGSTATAGGAIISDPEVLVDLASGKVGGTIARARTQETCDWFDLP
ncbi:MAG TPA: hypothetical protein VFQ54_11650, partial [Thermomicrobiales bacterium]|nr:hypothetical protein [Thermomicrobiales bacterium]